MPLLARGRRAVALAGSLSLALGLGASSLLSPAPATAAPTTPSHVAITSSGLPKGAIKHVWLIILENKSYDATFTGLNENSYLWRTLPQQGVLLKKYYGTGHFSQDNYVSMVSGQAPEQDMQSDCDVAGTDFSRNDLIESNGSLHSNPDYGQAVSTAGPNAPDGKNGCVYPSHVPTLFNQLDAAGKTWKGYAQDLGNQPGREDGACGYPGTATNAPDGTVDTGVSDTATAGTHQHSTALNAPSHYAGVASFTGVQAAGNDAAGHAGAKEDGYVAKHFPFPWFHALLDGTTAPTQGGSDCDSAHIANLDSQANGLFHDLQSEATTPAFSWITPNNCSDAHDAVCKGNNLSGAFKDDGTPDYTGVSPAYDPQGTTPKNYAGGLYASDLFLKWYVPLIEQSPAFKDGGLIDVTFDEANPPFANSSFNNANDPAFAPGAANSDPAFAPDGNRVLPGVADPADVRSFLAADSAGQNIDGKDVDSEPAGPNTPLTYRTDGVTPYPGPGDDGFIRRRPAGPRTDGASAAVQVDPTNPAVLDDNSITVGDAGRTVTGTNVPAGAFVGPVRDVGPLFPTQSVTATGGGLTPAASVVAGSFDLVDAGGAPLSATGPVSSVVLGGLTTTTDRLYDATDPTPGGGVTGSVLISPYIKPGSATSTYYNHYSWLRTMEDLFDVSSGSARTALDPGAGSVTGGLDGLGHLGYAAQPGLTPFGGDVFTSPPAGPASVTGPRITGPGRVGTEQTCSHGDWSGAPTSYSYRWLRDGQPSARATGSTYRLTGADFGTAVTCEVTASNGAGSATATSPALRPTSGGVIHVGRAPSIYGTPSVGQELGVHGLVTSPGTTSLRLQWLRDGSAISGATALRYRLVAADRGHLVTIAVTLVSTGYDTRTVDARAVRVR